MAVITTKKEYVDPITGEVQEFLVIAPKNVDSRFVKIFIPFVEEVFNDTDLVAKSFRLLLWIISKLDYNTLRFYMSPDKVCNELKISRRTFYYWRNTLVRKGIIFPLEDRYMYELRPYSVVKGVMYKVFSPLAGS
jgi:hypothetical protein